MTIESGTVFDPGRALWNRRHEVAAALPRLSAFYDLLSPLAMVMLPQDYSVLFATVREFQPDLVVEVGRMFGNTTCALTEAAHTMRETSVLSVCLTDHWQRTTMPRIQSVISPDWLARLDARVMNLVDLDVSAAFAGKRRVLFVLDAHGWELADFMLGAVMPSLAARNHILLVHDVVLPTHFAEMHERYFPDSPTRPTDGMNGYGGRGIWRGDQSSWDQFVFLNGLAGDYPEFIALVDFANRNGLPVHSVEASVRREIHDQPERRHEMEELIGDPMYQPWSAFAWFTAGDQDDTASLRFPTFRRRSSDGRALEELRYDLGRNLVRGRPSPITMARILTKAALGRYRDA